MMITMKVVNNVVHLKLQNNVRTVELDGEMNPIYINNPKRGAVATVIDLLVTHETMVARMVCEFIPENT